MHQNVEKITLTRALHSDKRIQDLKEDAVAAFSISLVTIPLSIGIAIASGIPPMSGIIAAVVGGIVATFLRSSHLTINGPAASLIVICIAAVQALGGGDALLGFRGFLAASFFAGLLLILMGYLRLGRYGDLFPASVIYGILGAIGLIIISQQVQVALDVKVSFKTTFEVLMHIPDMLFIQNPFVGIITILSLAVLITHRYIKFSLIQILPAPIWVIVLSFLMAFLFNFYESHQVFLLGKSFDIGPRLLIDVPTELQANLFFPDFSMVQTFVFWKFVILITLIVYIETMISAKAMDKIDPLNRKTLLSRDLTACGVSTTLSALIGGLPIITAVPLYYGAKTKFASFFQGILLLLFVLFIPFIVRGIPHAALATLLIFTGYKLASPKIFKDTYYLGFEQFVTFFSTMVVILFQGVLLGAVFGFVITLLIHYTKSHLSSKQFCEYLWRPVINTKRKENGEVYIEAKGVINCINILQLKQALRSCKKERHVIIDFSDARLVDTTVLEYLHEQVERYELPGVCFEIVGLDAHETASRHPNAMRVLPENKKPQLTKRQQVLEKLAQTYNGKFWPEVRWDISQFKEFSFFQKQAIDYKLNMAKGTYYLFFEWETSDITFSQGALFSALSHHTSVAVLHLPFHLPVFILERDGFLEKIGAKLAFFKDIDFVDYPVFSERFLLKGPNEKEIRTFFTETIIRFLEDNEQYHIECNGTEIIIFKEMQFASPHAMEKMHEFAHAFSAILLAYWKGQTNKIKV